MPRIIISTDLVAVLQERGIVPEHTRRIVIDLQVEEPAVLYYELLADERLLDVFQDPAVHIALKRG